MKDYQAGFKAGQEWAKWAATPKELQRCTKYLREKELRSTGNNSLADADYREEADIFAIIVRPNQKGNRLTAYWFWEEALGKDKNRAEDADFLRGFAAGAVDIWNKVKDRI